MPVRRCVFCGESMPMVGCAETGWRCGGCRHLDLESDQAPRRPQAAGAAPPLPGPDPTRQ